MDSLSGEQSVPLLLCCCVLIPPSPPTPPRGSRTAPGCLSQTGAMCWNNGRAANSRRGVRFTSASSGSTEPCVLPSLRKPRRNVALFFFFLSTPLLTTRCPHFKLTHMHALSHFARVRVCYPRSDFPPEVLKRQLSINPPRTRTRLFCLFFFSPLALREKQRVWFTPLHAYPLPEILGSWWLIPLTPLLLFFSFLFFLPSPPGPPAACC